MKAPDLLVRQVMSVVIAKFPDNPSSSHRNAMVSFCALMKKLYGIGRKPDTRSRDRLTSWAQSNFALWREADFAASAPPLWGPLFWRLMLRCARLYKRKRRWKFSAWLESLMYLLPCKKCAKHYRRMLQSSTGKWKRVKTAADCVGYISWMQRTVKLRVQKEGKIYSLTTFKREEPWGATDANAEKNPTTRKKNRGAKKGRSAVRTAVRTANRTTHHTTPMIQNEGREKATRNIRTRNTSTRNRNASELSAWYGAISGVGANFFG
jgi:hypothetical protein